MSFSTVSIAEFEQVNVSWESRDLIEGEVSETFRKILMFHLASKGNLEGLSQDNIVNRVSINLKPS